MKKLIIVAMIAACVALCAAVWPHGNEVEETPVPAAETRSTVTEGNRGVSAASSIPRGTS